MKKETLQEKAERIKQETAYEEEGYSEHIARQLHWFLRETRNEPGLSLREIAEICKEVFDEAEIEAFIRELKNKTLPLNHKRV